MNENPFKMAFFFLVFSELPFLNMAAVLLNPSVPNDSFQMFSGDRGRMHWEQMG